jgi:prophage regulatory protein
METYSNPIPDTGYLRIWHIVGDKKRGLPPILPISKSTWWNGVKSGKYPKPVKLGSRITAWKADDIRKLIEAEGVDV